MTRNVYEQLKAAGYLDHLASYALSENTIIGFATPAFLEKLKGDTRFANGMYYGYHRDVGTHLKDFRSHTGALGPGSLQVVIDTQTLAIYSDVDKFSPYSDLVGVFGHVFGELVPHAFRKLFGKKRAKPASLLGPSIFSSDELAAVIRDTIPMLPEGHRNAVVAGVTPDGVHAVARVQFQQERWTILAAVTQAWTGETTVGASVLLSW